MARYKDAINAFFGGHSADPRIQKLEQAFISSHYDIYTNPKKLTPYRNMEADETTADKITLVDYGADGTLYGLGVVSGQTYVQVYKKASNPISGSWASVTNGASASGARSARVFKQFHNYYYGLRNGDSIWAWGDFTGSPTFTEQAQAVSYTAGEEAQGIVTSDDFLLIPYGNKIAKKDGAGSGPTSTWTAAALTLPSDLLISDLVEIDSQNVAVLCRPKSGEGRSRLYLWNKIDVDVSDYLDWGEGQGLILDLIESEVVGISQVGSLIRPKIVWRTWAGGKARVIGELQADDTTLTLYGNHTKFRQGNVLCFGLKIKLDGTTYHQLASLGRQSDGFPLAFALAQLVDNDTAITSIEGASRYNDYVFVAHNNDGSLNRTNDTDLYTSATATYITQKITGERQSLDFVRQTKTLGMCGIVCEPLPASTTLSLYMRVDGGSWQKVRDYTTTGGTGFEAGILNDSTEFPSGKDFQFKVTTVGTATGSKGEAIAVVYAYDLAGGDVSDP